MSTNQRIRGRRLQAIRAYEFTRNPFCARCGKPMLFLAEAERDHTVPVAKGGADTRENTALLCKPCHADKTREDMGYRKRPTIGLDGYPEEAA